MQVFISYSSGSKKWAHRLADALSNNGIKPLLDDEKLKPGVAWQAEIEKAVKSSNSVVGLFDPSAQDDPSQRWKWAEILDLILEEQERPLIPILLHDAEMPGFLHSVQAIRVKDPSREWDEAVESLVEVLKKKKKLDDVKLVETVTVSEKAKSEQRKRLHYIGMVAESQKSARKGSAE
jgi:hypothetical protein